MSKNIINIAVEKVNEGRLAEAVNKVQGIMASIEREQKQVELLTINIKETQDAIHKMEANELTFEKVYGAPAPASPTLTQRTIITAVEEIVKSRQEDIKARAGRMGQDIANRRDEIAQAEERIAKYRAELDKVQPAIVDATVITG